MVIPGVHDTFCDEVRLEDGSQTCCERTSDVFLLWRGLVRAGSLLDVDY